MSSDSGIEYDKDYHPPKEPHTWVDWLMLAASAIFFLVAVYFWVGGK